MGAAHCPPRHLHPDPHCPCCRPCRCCPCCPRCCCPCCSRRSCCPHCCCPCCPRRCRCPCVPCFRCSVVRRDSTPPIPQVFQNMTNFDLFIRHQQMNNECNLERSAPTI